MSAGKLPSKLGREPLIDAVFEVRFEAAPGAAEILPGLLFSRLKGVQGIQSLPVAQVPEQVRNLDPNFRYMPTSRLLWGKYVVPIGAQVLGVGCKLPYPGWANFRTAILEVLQVLAEVPLVSRINRCSLKYIDLFEVPDNAAALQMFNIGITVGSERIENHNAQLRVEMPRGRFLHAISAITSASIGIDGVPTPKTGAILDVDTLVSGLNMAVGEFVTAAPSLIDEIHTSNKEIFFGCITPAGLQKLEPQYE